MTDVQDIQALVDEILPEVAAIRRALHQMPEIALQETDTAAAIREKLAELDVEVLPPFLETDVVAILRGRADGENVTLRADMDALPMDEQTGAAHASRRPGCMHACGHDGHIAMVLGAAAVLQRLRETFDGSVRFVFQPGEEMAAAGKDLVAAGALRDPEPRAILALHAWQGMPTGVIASRPGPMMGAADFFEVVIHGRGAHASMPERSVDPILTACRVVEALQSVASRRMSPLDPVVVSVCRIHGGSADNIIPDRVALQGTVRYLDPVMLEPIRRAMTQEIEGTCAAAGATCDFSYVHDYVPTINHAEIVALGERVAREALGPDGWRELKRPSMGAEDFAYYLTEHPGAMFYLGMGEDSPPLHSPQFDFNDEALRAGMIFLVAATLEALRTGAAGD